MLTGAYILTTTGCLLGIQEKHTGIEFLYGLAQKIVALQPGQQTRKFLPV